jgi:hypothetical protein
MAITDPKDTLAYQMARPLTLSRDRGHAPSARVAERLAAYRQDFAQHKATPDAEALWFYGLNHGMARILAEKAPLEPLGDCLPFVEAYHARIGEKAVRAFYYLLVICVREARHLNNKAEMRDKLRPQFGKVVDYLGVVPDSPGQAMDIFCTKPPAGRLGQFTDLLCRIFFHGSWASSYGGKRWGEIAKCLHRFVTGTYTAEMMLDTVWTLAHNTGPIFNKGMLYHGHTANLARILDVQRSGQIPAMILHDTAVVTQVDKELRQRMHWLAQRFPDAVPPYVDWFVVDALGALGKYPTEQMQQVQQHGPSPFTAKAQQLALAAAKQAELEALKQKQKYFQINPTLAIEKFKRKAA